MKIAAGLGKNKNIIEASQQVDFEVILTESEKELVEMLLCEEVDVAVRGSLSSSKILPFLKKGDTKLYRSSFLEFEDHKFLFAPVGIDEAESFDDKLAIIGLGTEFLLKLGIEPKIGIISGARLQDIGRSKRVDKLIEDTEKLIKIIKSKYSVKHYLIEDAIKDNVNLILAPDGISGNLIFRTLVFLGSGKSHGAVTLGIEKIFIDTSRSQSVEGYKRALDFSYYLARLKSRTEHGNTKTTL